jgi:uncharacterized protein (TIGR03083 family)
MPTTSTTLTPTRAETIEGVVHQYEELAALVASLTDAEWATPSRCEGFDVRDVAGHVIGLAEDIAAGRPGSRTPEQEAASVRDDPPARAAGRLTTALGTIREILARLDRDEVWDGPSPLPDLTMAEAILTVWYDTYVHTDDIRVAIGRSPVSGPGERASVARLVAELNRRGFGPARIELVDTALPAIELGPVDGSTPTARMRAHEFILAATGRLDAAPLGLDPAVNIYAP